MTHPKDTNEGPNPSGLCVCGCGNPAPIAKETNRRLGHVAGQPIRFIHGHHARLQKTTLRYTVDRETGCWNWTGGRSGRMREYGHVQYQGRSMNAHHAAYLMLRGPIPDGMVLDHAHCQNPACINPDHMEIVTNTVNIRRGKRTKLTPEIVREIRARWPQESIAALARHFGVSETIVHRVIHRERWIDV